MGQIEKIVSFSKRGSLSDNYGTITNVQLLMTLEKFNFLKYFKTLLRGGGGTTKNWKILANRKKMGDFHELDNFKQKIFLKIEIANVIFWKIFRECENIVWSIAQI